MTIHYRIEPVSPEAHLFAVILTVSQPDPAGQQFWLPTWIPGSYLIRDFARHIVSIQASSQGKPVALTHCDLQRWQAAHVDGALQLEYTVYAADLSVRGAWLDQTRGFFNGTSVFLAVAGQENTPHQVEILPPSGETYTQWQVATTLPAVAVTSSNWGQYQAANYDELIDHPVELGEFMRLQFEACGIVHDVAIAGRLAQLDQVRLCKDMQQICETQIRFFGAAPFERYLFLVLAVGDGYGGLEHRSSTSLIASRADLPLLHETTQKTGYRRFLGLVSHEYFHSWNVKRIKPASFVPYRLGEANLTRLLWAFEGITSYYDDLMLRRSGVISEQDYLELLAQTLTQVERMPGRYVQTLEEASLDAWIKYYQPNENSANALVSYYTKGALVALALDLTLRQHSQGKCSLDDVMRCLWQRFGAADSAGVGEAEWEAVAAEVAGFDLQSFFDLALRSTTALPLAELFQYMGVQSQLRITQGAQDQGGWQAQTLPRLSLGAKLEAEAGFTKLKQVFTGGAAQRAGLSANDVLVAWDDLRVTPEWVERQLTQRQPGDVVKLCFFRRDELMHCQLQLQSAVPDTWGLRLDETDATAVLRRQHWLNAIAP